VDALPRPRQGSASVRGRGVRQGHRVRRTGAGARAAAGGLPLAVAETVLPFRPLIALKEYAEADRSEQVDRFTFREPMVELASTIQEADEACISKRRQAEEWMHAAFDTLEAVETGGGSPRLHSELEADFAAHVLPMPQRGQVMQSRRTSVACLPS
jgi:hypothetical protein